MSNNSEVTNDIKIGWLEVCLNVKDINKSYEFYSKLGFKQVQGNLANGWVTLDNGECRIALYQGHIERNLLNFRGEDIDTIGAILKQKGLTLSKDVNVETDGSKSCELIDPDGNVLYFNTFPGETKSNQSK